MTAALVLGSASPDARAQVGDPGEAKAVVACEKNVSNAGRAYITNSYKALQKCVDTIFGCVQLKPGDQDCLTKAHRTCDKQFLKMDSLLLKLELAVDKRCAEEVVSFAALRTTLAANIDSLASDCRPYDVVVIGSLNDYKDCLLSAYQCRVGDLLRFAAPRAREMLGLVGRGLVGCPTPTPVSTSTSATRTPTPTTTRTPTPISVTPTATATPQFNRVFVTSTLQNGALGGLTGADDICRIRAAAASLPGTYVAWLSTSTVNAANRLGSARGFVRVDGKPFANTVADITANRIWHPLKLNESGADVSAGVLPGSSNLTVFTGTLEDGTLATGANCSNFTDTGGIARRGDVSGGPVTWTARQNSNCTTARRLVCFQTNHSGADLVPAPTVGKLAFVSTKGFAPGPGVGIAGADALCASNAMAAGLSGTFKALLSTTTASAASRFTLAPLYVRPDGIAIATGTTIAASDPLESGIWQRADGSYVPASGDLVFTGAATPSSLGTLTSTCNDWTSSATLARCVGGSNVGAECTASTECPTSSCGGAIIGADTFADSSWWNLSSPNPPSCAQPQPIAVYCLQE